MVKLPESVPDVVYRHLRCAKPARGFLSSTSCRHSVWDNGDTDNCGEPAVRHGFCEHHYTAVCTSLIDQVNTLESQLGELRAFIGFFTEGRAND
jgi:hypothetical protein